MSGTIIGGGGWRTLGIWTLSPTAVAELRMNEDPTIEDLAILREYIEKTIQALTRRGE